jgi:hypothetical protein
VQIRASYIRSHTRPDYEVEGGKLDQKSKLKGKKVML